MALPSQSGRSSGSSRAHYRKKRSKLPPWAGWLGGFVALVLLALGYLALTGDDSASDGPDDGSSGGPGQETEATQATRSTERAPDGMSQPTPPRTATDPGSFRPEPTRSASDSGRPQTQERLGSTLGSGSPQPQPQPQPESQAQSDPVVIRQDVPSRNTLPTSGSGASGRTDPARLSDAMNIEPALDVDGPLGDLLESAKREMQANRPVVARELLNRALRDARATDGDRAQVRAQLARLNESLIFGPEVQPDDPLAWTYTVQPGDSLSRIARRQGLAVDWRFVQRVNRISDPKRIRVGQRLKVVQGPFHAVVIRSAYRLDLYAGPPEDPSEWVYVRSYDVGLGEEGSTPSGEFVVKADSKLINPYWINPRTGEHFEADHPENPIGERWIGIEGLGESAVHTGYGLHGTIEPESIGQQRSMGCVRMLGPDVEVVYELLVEESSRVLIRP